MHAEGFFHRKNNEKNLEDDPGFWGFDILLQASGEIPFFEVRYAGSLQGSLPDEDDCQCLNKDKGGLSLSQPAIPFSVPPMEKVRVRRVRPGSTPISGPQGTASGTVIAFSTIVSRSTMSVVGYCAVTFAMESIFDFQSQGERDPRGPVFILHPVLIVPIRLGSRRESYIAEPCMSPSFRPNIPVHACFDGNKEIDPDSSGK